MINMTDQHFNPGTGTTDFNLTPKVFEWNKAHITQFKKDILRAMKDELFEHYRGIQIYEKGGDGNDAFKILFPFQMYYLKDYTKLYLFYRIPDQITTEVDQYFNLYQIFNNRFYQIAKQDYGWELRVVSKDCYAESVKKRNRYVEVFHKKIPIYTTGLWFNKVYYDKYEFIQDKIVFKLLTQDTLLNKTELQRKEIMEQYVAAVVEINKNFHLTGGQHAARGAYSAYKSLMNDMFGVTLPDAAINKCETWDYEVEMLGESAEERKAMNDGIL